MYDLQDALRVVVELEGCTYVDDRGTNSGLTLLRNLEAVSNDIIHCLKPEE